MKKIVALVLSLVMVLGLATTAMAYTADTYDLYYCTSTLADDIEDRDTCNDNVKGIALTVVGANQNTDGSGNVAYVTLKINGVDYYYVKTTTPYTTSIAVTYAEEDDILFYVDYVEGATADTFKYNEAVTKFADFGLKCGQLPDLATTALDTFFQTEDGDVYKATSGIVPTTSTYNYLLDGKIVTVDTAYNKQVVKHAFVFNDYSYNTALKQNVPVKALCTNCLAETSEIYLKTKVPATYTAQPTTGEGSAVYTVALADPAVVAPAAPSTDKVESAETFDAGIAMYVGMSVMAAAGSAVVLKKKD